MIANQIQWLVANRAKIARYLFIPQLLIAFLFLGFAYQTGHSRVRLLSRGVETQGRIVSFRAERMSQQTTSNSRLSATDYAYLPTVEFPAPGRIVRLEEWMGYGTDSGVGTMVPILYDPADPSVAMIDRGAVNWLPWAPCAAIGTLLALAATRSLVSLLLSIIPAK